MVTHGAAFGAGFVSGWLARSAVGSTREAIVRGLALAMKLRDRMRRAAADQMEWWEDMVAEADSRRTQQLDEERNGDGNGAPAGNGRPTGPIRVVPSGNAGVCACPTIEFAASTIARVDCG